MPFPRTTIELVGNLGKEPESRFTPGGEMVTSFSVAVTRQWGQGDQQQKETTWWNISTWGKLAEACQSLIKGQQVMVKGYLKPDPKTGRPRVWTGQDGTAGASYDLTANEVWLSLFGKASAQAQTEGGPGYSDPNLDNEPPSEDIPF